MLRRAFLSMENIYRQAWNTNMLSALDLLIKVAIFIKKENNIFYFKKELI